MTEACKFRNWNIIIVEKWLNLVEYANFPRISRNFSSVYNNFLKVIDGPVCGLYVIGTTAVAESAPRLPAIHESQCI